MEGERREATESERKPGSSGSPLGPSLQQSHESSNKFSFFSYILKLGFYHLQTRTQIDTVCIKDPQEEDKTT